MITRSPRRATTPLGALLVDFDMNNDNKRQLEQERQELNTLIGKGVSFEIKDVEVETQSQFFGLVKKHIRNEVTRKYTINEPTLATLDRLSREWVEFAIDDDALKSSDGMNAARTLARTQAIRCARVIAIAVLGEDRLIPMPGIGCTRWIEDEHKVEELTELFARTIKPSRLYQLYSVVNTMCNLGDFVNSIRLMCTERTTAPNRIE